MKETTRFKVRKGVWKVTQIEAAQIICMERGAEL